MNPTSLSIPKLFHRKKLSLTSLKTGRFSKANLIVFIFIFGAIGAFALFQSSAAGTTANLWIDTNGGTCTRQATAGAYNDAAACSSFQAAFDTASAGDLVLVKAGSYANQTISGAKAVTFQAALGESVTVGTSTQAVYNDTGFGIAASGATFRDMTVPYFHVTGTNVTIDNFKSETWDSGSGVNNMLVENSNFGPYAPQCVGGNWHDNPTINGGSGVIIRNNTFHDTSDTNCSGAHMDCFQVAASSGLLFEGNKLLNCYDNGIILTGDDNTTMSPITLQNNWFGPTITGQFPVRWNNHLACPNAIIQYNTVLSGVNTNSGFSVDCAGSPTIFRGNVESYTDAFNCGGTAMNGTITYNVSQSGTTSGCGTNAKVGNVAFVNAPSAGAAYTSYDYHISSGSIARGAGDPANFPTLDLDGDTRTSPPDAGADQYVVSGGPTANIWMDTNGGTCTRSATAVAYNDATACSSLASAWTAAVGGDTILIKGGAPGTPVYYPGNNSLSGSKASTVTIKSAPGEDAWLTGTLSLNGVTNASFTDERAGANARNNNAANIGQGLVVGSRMFTGSGSANISFKDVDLWCQNNSNWPLYDVYGGDGAIGVLQDTNKCSVEQQVNTNTTNWSWTGGSIGPHMAGAQSATGILDDIKINCTPASTCNTVKWDGVWVHDWIKATGDTSTHHDEWMKLDAGTNVSIVNNRFQVCSGCASAGLFIDNSNGDLSNPTNWLIQNNFIGKTAQGQSISIGYMTSLTGFKILYNTMEGDLYISSAVTSGSGNQIVGNIADLAAFGTCPSFGNYDHNLWFTDYNANPGVCGTNYTSLGPSYSLSNLFTEPSDTSVNLHLVSASPAKDKGGTACSGLTDFDGDSRPQGTACDAGADETASGGTSGTRYISATGTNTGACTNQASPCLTMDYAYHQANSGETVQMANGSYGDQTLTADATKTSAITFQPVSGATVTIHILAANGAKYVTFKNLNTTRYDASGGANHITWQNVSTGSFYITNATDLSILGGSVGPWDANALGLGEDPQIGTSLSPQPNNILIDGVTFHDILNTTDSTAHADCMQFTSGTNVTIQNNTFKHCGNDADVYIRGDFGPVSNFTIQNNFFGASQGFFSLRLSGQSGAAPVCTNFMIRNNSGVRGATNSSGGTGDEMWGDCTAAGANGVKWIGNIAGSTFSGDCTTSQNVGEVWQYNISLAGTACGSNATIGTASYANTGASTLDLHLTLGTSTAVNYIPSTYCSSNPGYCASNDIDGDTKPQGSAFDAGADEFISGGGTGKLGDLNNDNAVNILDLSILLSHYGQSATPSQGDLNSDSICNITDLSILLSKWGS